MPQLTHHALGLVDILDLVCSHSNLRSLARLACTSKLLHSVSISHIWGNNRVDFWAVLNLLPGAVRKYGDNVEIVEDIPTTYTDGYFARLSIYAPLITAVSAQFVPTNQEASLLQQAQSLSGLTAYMYNHTFFPKLSVVEVTFWYGYQQHVAGVSWLCLLVSPSLTVVSIASCTNPYRNSTELPMHVVALGAFSGLILKTCQNLRRLSLHTQPLALNETMGPDETFTTTCVFSELEYLALDPLILRSDSMAWLSQMPRLSSLVIESDVIDTLATSNIFSIEISTLTYLRIGDCTSISFVSRLWCSPLVRHLKSVTLGLVDLLPSDVTTIANLIAARTSRVSALTICLRPPIHIVPFLQKIRNLPLRELKIIFPAETESREVGIVEHAARYWPELETFSIKRCIVGYSELSGLSVCFPRLRLFELALPFHGPMFGEDILKQSRYSPQPQHRLMMRANGQHLSHLDRAEEICLGVFLAISWPKMDFRLAAPSSRRAQADINAQIQKYSERLSDEGLANEILSSITVVVHT